jgi:hypothetical protein
VKRRNVGKLNNELNIVNQLVDLHFLLFVNITWNWKNRLAHTRKIIIFQRAADACLSQGEFKPSYSDSVDRGSSIIRVIKSAENRIRSNLELLPVMNAKSRPRYISALNKVVNDISRPQKYRHYVDALNEREIGR